MSERDELADLIYRGQYRNPHSKNIQPLMERPDWEIAANFRAAGEVLDAGWRPPLRDLTTPTELGAV